ncbi:methyltransferase domain protein [Ostertagia ostertagi]
MTASVSRPQPRLFRIGRDGRLPTDVVAGFEPLGADIAQGWGRYGQMLHQLASLPAGDGPMLAFVPDDVVAVCKLDAGALARAVAALPPDLQAMPFSPQPDVGAFFLNVFEHVETFSPGFIAACEPLLAGVGLNVALRALVMDSRHVALDGCLAATPAFWHRWASCAAPLMASLDALPPDHFLQQYDDALGAPRRWLLLERLASLLLALQPWPSRALAPFDRPWSKMRFANYRHEAVICDALKQAWREHSFPQYQQAYSLLRQRFGEQQAPLPWSPPARPASEIPTSDTDVDAIPVLVICYDNHVFVENTVAQLQRLGVKDIVVIDNASTRAETRAALDRLPCRVIRNTENLGHLCWVHPSIYPALPTKFCVTDPDLQFNPNLPRDFMHVLSRLSDRYGAQKVGFALDIADAEAMYADPDYHQGLSIADWEHQFWQQPLSDRNEPGLEIYLARVDTTFHLFNKTGSPHCHLRLAGNYTARHLPWYRSNEVADIAEMNAMYRSASSSSTMAKLHHRHHSAPAAPATSEADTAAPSPNAEAQHVDSSIHGTALHPTGAPMPALSQMKQTPAHAVVNGDLLALIPVGKRRVVEIGCMHGALAREYLLKSPDSEFIGVDIDADYAQVAAGVCTRTLAGDIERLDDKTFDSLFPSDCWVFGDCLEHLRDPWRLLARVRERIDPDGCVVICIPNAQHWSVQMRLATGLFRYEDSGLLDRTHLRWFTRVTLLEMFQQSGWNVQTGLARRLPQAAPPAILEGIRLIAQTAGADPAQAASDAEVFQYLFTLVRA